MGSSWSVEINIFSIAGAYWSSELANRTRLSNATVPIVVDRSNFYRFSPELGVADALSTLVLLVRARWRGYQWWESLVAVFVVREGVGRGDLWWREKIYTARFEVNRENNTGSKASQRLS